MASSLERVSEIYQDRGRRARELKANGQGVIGYLCSFTPVELITAAGLLPFRFTGGGGDPITEADVYLERIACPYTRSILDLALKGKYDFADGFVMPHSCDNVVNLYDVWAQAIDHLYAHFVNVPHTPSAASVKFFGAELGVFKKSLEKFTGREITTEALRRAIELHNEQRALVRELYELRKKRPSPLAASEVTRIIVATMSLPVEEANDLLGGVIAEVAAREERGSGAAGGGPRLLVHGTGNDETAFMEIVEGVGAEVVVDDMCFGTRPYWYDVPVTEDPLEGLGRGYLEGVRCPRTFRPSPGTHEEDLENRFGHMYDLAREYGASGAILYIIRYCDTHAFDAPDLKEYLEGKGLPVLVLEEDYPVSSTARLKTRVQAFSEVLL
jgi:bzd-type benzoyl-CoA reductase N subunit